MSRVEYWGHTCLVLYAQWTKGDLRAAQFFNGVATVCTKLFNAVEPDHAYFGQKDIQQALLLKLSESSVPHQPLS